MNDKLVKLKSLGDINAALKAYRGESYVEPPKKVICSDKYKKLSRHQVDQGVIALVHACNLSGGSIGDVDLYKLNRMYLWNEEARDAINLVLKRYES